MSKSSEEVQTVRLDPGAEAFRDFTFDESRRVSRGTAQPFTGEAVAGLDPSTVEGFSRLGEIDPNILQALRGTVGNLGFAAEQLRGAGGPLDISQFQDPFTEQVIGGVQADFQRQRELSLNAVGANATAAGAFGGSRQALAEAETLRGLGAEEGRITSGLRSQGFQSAVQAALAQRQQQLGAAGQLANIGFGGIQGLEGLLQRSAGAQIGLGEARRGIEQARNTFDVSEFMRLQEDPFRRVGLLNQTLSGAPAGQTQTTRKEGNLLSSLIGGAATIGSAFIPGGALAGVIPGVAGLFGGGGGDIVQQAPQLVNA
jgi:hypothetical protein